jgi:hypothetical protein
MNKSSIFKLLGVSLISFQLAAAPQLTAESEALVEQLKTQIKGTLLAIGKNEAKVGKTAEDINLTIELPAQKEANLGLLLDVDEPSKGFKILSVTPGSTAESLDLEIGANLVSFNNTKIQSSNSIDILNQIQMLSAGDSIQFSVDNGNNVSSYNTTLEGRFTPTIRLQVGTPGAKVAANMLEADSSACGYVSVLFGPPRSRDLYASYINKIDDNATIRSRHSFKLSAGKHQIYVHELIDDPSLKRRRGGMKSSKLIEVNIEPNKTYHIAAKFDRKKRTRKSREEYWNPVVWKTSDSECEL